MVRLCSSSFCAVLCELHCHCRGPIAGRQRRWSVSGGQPKQPQLWSGTLSSSLQAHFEKFTNTTRLPLTNTTTHPIPHPSTIDRSTSPSNSANCISLPVLAVDRPSTASATQPPSRTSRSTWSPARSPLPRRPLRPRALLNTRIPATKDLP